MRIGTLISTGLATLLAASALAGAASAQSAIRVGQTINGTLSASDPVLEVDGSTYDCYILEATPGVTYTIDMSSSEFDTFLGVGRGRVCNPPVEYNNDDRSEDDTNSRVVFTAGVTAAGSYYFIIANSYEAGETGAYRLTVSEGGSAEASTGAEYENLTRPTDAAERYDFDMTCSAFGTLGMIELMQEEMSDAELQQLLADNYTLITNAEQSGAAIGKSADEVNDEVAELAAEVVMDPELAEVLPPVALRAACLRASGL